MTLKLKTSIKVSASLLRFFLKKTLKIKLDIRILIKMLTLKTLFIFVALEISFVLSKSIVNEQVYKCIY